MRIWLEYYDEKTKRIGIMEGDDNDVNFCSNIYDGTISYFDDSYYATKAMENANKAINEGRLFVRKCKDCPSYYYANEDEDKFFIDKGLSIPKRCPRCRAINRLARRNLPYTER